jgi:hypothetical protein
MHLSIERSYTVAAPPPSVEPIAPPEREAKPVRPEPVEDPT